MRTDLNKKRLLSLQGAHNVRDLGGYPAIGGRTVCWGKVYRSGDLNNLTDADLSLLERLQVATIVDFRSAREREEAPHRVPATVTEVVTLPINAGDMVALTEFTEDNGQELMVKINRDLVDFGQKQYAEFFSLLTEETRVPLLFNCSAGKDRTGFAAALFLASLGVPREVIYEDYMLSAALVEEKYKELVALRPNLAAAMTVRRPYLEGAFAEIDSRFGGPERYLRDRLHVDAHLMRRMYTEQA